MTTSNAGGAAAPPRPPDRPVVPRPRFSTAAIVFGVLGTLIVGSYTLIAFTGYEAGSPAREGISGGVPEPPISA